MQWSQSLLGGSLSNSSSLKTSGYCARYLWGYSSSCLGSLVLTLFQSSSFFRYSWTFVTKTQSPLPRLESHFSRYHPCSCQSCRSLPDNCGVVLIFLAYDWSFMDLVHPLSTCADICNKLFAVLILASRWNAFGFCFLMILLTWGSSCNACRALSSGSLFNSWANPSSNFLWESGAHTLSWVRATLMGLSLMCDPSVWEGLLKCGLGSFFGRCIFFGWRTIIITWNLALLPRQCHSYCWASRKSWWGLSAWSSWALSSALSSGVVSKTANRILGLTSWLFRGQLEEMCPFWPHL